jgi:hypothetical protein
VREQNAQQRFLISMLGFKDQWEFKCFHYTNTGFIDEALSPVRFGFFSEVAKYLH